MPCYVTSGECARDLVNSKARLGAWLPPRWNYESHGSPRGGVPLALRAGTEGRSTLLVGAAGPGWWRPSVCSSSARPGGPAEAVPHGPCGGNPWRRPHILRVSVEAETHHCPSKCNGMYHGLCLGWHSGHSWKHRKPGSLITIGA